MKATLRGALLPRLRASGPLGTLLARQCAAYAQDQGMAELGRAYPGLPDDLVNFHWDPLACAVALGWPGAVTDEVRLRPVLDGQGGADGGALRFEPDRSGRATRILTDLDGMGFAETWIAAVEAAQTRR
ncbi:MAG TPA: hypothetical protein VFX70_17170 [Mycobacteriales bacterium]|nr:hypothetical protein [Mycobacteriales bacterium]